MFAIDRRYETVSRYVDLACSAKDEEMGAALRRYCTVLMCGFVERSVEIIVLERLKNRAHPRIIQFVKSHFRRGTNYDCKAISSLLERFEPDWKIAFEDFMQHHEQEVEALTSTYSVRNSIAHGATAGISPTVLKERLGQIRIVVDAIIQATK